MKTQIYKINNRQLRLIIGDITEQHTDAIVNAANAQLILGGGVAGAIRSKGGPSIQEECNRIGGTIVGEAVCTGAGYLPATYVIHAVGPMMGEGNEDEKLRNAVHNSLLRAEEKNLESIAFPAISTGIFGYPPERCAEVMLTEMLASLRAETTLTEVTICLWDKETFRLFNQQADRLNLPRLYQR